MLGFSLSRALEPERVHQSEDGVLCMENLGEVMMGAFAPLEESMHRAGNAPQTDTANDGKFEQVRALDNGLESFRAEDNLLKENFSKIFT